MTYTALYYFAVGYIPGQPNRVPIRVELTGSRVSYAPPGAPPLPVTVFHHIYDFVDWVPGPPQTFAPFVANPFAIPSDCVWGTGRPGQSLLVTLPTADTVVPEPTDSPPFPVLPVAYQMLVEAKLDDGTENSWAVTWLVDSEAQSERVMYTSQGVLESSLVWWSHTYAYTKPFEYTQGELYLSRNGQCTTSMITADNGNPLSNLRAGFFVDLFRGTIILAVPPAYQGRKLARDVLADVWRTSVVRTVSGVTYNFIADIYFFPQGWVFPGRLDVTSTDRIPMRITTNGTTSTGLTYADTWDIYKFLPVAPDPSMLAHELLGCDAADNGVVILDGTTPTSIVLISIFSAIAAVAILAAVLFFTKRWRKKNNPEAPIRLEETGGVQITAN